VQLRILVVEDVATSRRFLIKVLQRQLPRAIITEAEDGQEALDAYAAASPTSKPSVVLMDKEMPRMDGYAATRRLRAMGFRGPIIGITGDAGQAAVDEFVAQGAVDVVTKPVQMAALLDIIERELTLPAVAPLAVGAGVGVAGVGAVARPDSPPSRSRSDGGSSKGSSGTSSRPPDRP
jgi:CheY-like chemotaxis protein